MNICNLKSKFLHHYQNKEISKWEKEERMNHTEEKNEKNTKEKMLTKNMIKISMIKSLLREVVVQLMKTCNCLEIWVINN